MVARIQIGLAGMLAAAAVAGPSAATVYFSEDFNNPAFVGANIIDSGSDATSDRWATTYYYLINPVDGWTFSSSGAYLAVNPDTSDGALLLNENGGQASQTISGLTAGKTYAVSFLIWGDNRQGQPWVFDLSADGNPVDTINGVDGAPGTNPGVEETAYFTAGGSSETLTFSQSTPQGSQASPIIDNIVVTNVPEPATWAIMTLGVFGLGASFRRTRRAITTLA